MNETARNRTAETILSVIFAIFLFGSGYWFGQSRFAPVQLGTDAPYGTPSQVAASFDPFWEVWETINAEYYTQPLDPNMLVEGAITGMLESLEDPNTAYLSPADQESAEQQMDQEFEGIGAEVQSEDGNITIVAPFEGSPAAKAGLRPRDIIRSADGVELTDMDIAEAAALVRGPAGTSVTLEIERDGELFEVVIVRDTINIPSVRGEMLEDDIAYIRLSRFANKTSEELTLTLNELMAQNPRALILDLRLNPGGALDTVVAVADQFIGEGLILTERFGNGFERPFSATEEGLAQEIPMVVLIDEGSASASEVLAGAIRDHDRGILIGTTSFGKGTVQSWQPLRNGGGVRLTVARWLTPDGGWVHEIGLTPDISVALPEFDENFEDTQLQAAIDYFSRNQ